MTQPAPQDARAELERITTLTQRWHDATDPQLSYSGRWVRDMLNKILTGTYE